MSSSNSGACVICGQRNLHSLSACQGCGARLPWVSPTASPQSTSSTVIKGELKASLSNVWVQIASFLIPLVGIVLYFIYRTKNPVRANSALYAAALGIALNLVLMLTAK